MTYLKNIKINISTTSLGIFVVIKKGLILIQILLFGNQPDSKVVQLIGTLPPETKLVYPMMKSLNYRLWASFLRELDLSKEWIIFLNVSHVCSIFYCIKLKVS